MSKDIRTEYFIKNASKLHGNKYDYSKVEYKSAHEKVCVICPTHGEFWQRPNHHMKGCGSPKCAIEYRANLKRSNTDEFIEKARKVHGDKFDYSKVEYVKCDEKVCIICPIHGEFWQTPENHLYGKGCPKCASKNLTLEERISKFKVIHGDRYDYSKVEYKGADEKICIICPTHGEFWQTAHGHLTGHGCSKCRRSHVENDISRFLTENGINFKEQKRFKWLGFQSYDFYLTEYNIAIECQGEQHFIPVNKFGGEENLKITIERDINKIKLSKENGIKLLHYVDDSIKVPENWNLYQLITSKEELLKIIKG